MPTVKVLTTGGNTNPNTSPTYPNPNLTKLLTLLIHL